MKDKNGLALKSGIWYTAATFLLRGIGLITTPLFARLLTQSDFGIYSNFHSWQNVFNIFISLNFVATLISAKYDYEKEFDSYILSMAVFTAFNSFLLLIIINIFQQFFVNLMKLDLEYINLMVIYYLFSSAISLFLAKERYLYEYKKTVFLSLLNSISSTILAVVFVVLWENKVRGRIIGMAIPTIVIGFFLFISLFIKGKRIKLSYLKYALPICLPYIPHTLSTVMLSSMDKIQISSICGFEENALYSLAYSCGTLITMFTTSLNNAYVPWFADKFAANEYKDVHKFSKYYIGGFIYISFGLMLFSPEILLVMGGKTYLPAKYVMSPVAVGIVFQVIYTLFVNIEQISKKTTYMAGATMIAAAVNYITNLIFIPIFGYVAAAYTTEFSYLLLLLLHMLIVYKLGYRELYSYKFIYGVVVFGIGLSIIVNFIYLNNVVRYIFALIYCVITITILIRYRGKLRLLVTLLKNKDK